MFTMMYNWDCANTLKLATVTELLASLTLLCLDMQLLVESRYYVVDELKKYHCSLRIRCSTLVFDLMLILLIRPQIGK